MTARDIIMSASGSGVGITYVDDVFSTYLYTGNGSTQTITNGIDLAGKGGMVWIKQRNNPEDHNITDTERGYDKTLFSNLTNSQETEATRLTSFNTNGFSVGSSARTNALNNTYASWTFRKAPKFFDVVTYTGNGVAGRQIPHSLGVAPGMIILKRTNVATDWWVYHRSTGANQLALLNLTDAFTASSLFPSVSSTSFQVDNGPDNNTGDSYVAYLFAHDPSADGIIQCGSFNCLYGQFTDVTLGWEPQYILWKALNGGGGKWNVLDVYRGWTNNGNFGSDPTLSPNNSTAESFSESLGNPTSNGFWIKGQNNNGVNGNYIYLAIRRPNKPPTTGAEVYFGSATLPTDVTQNTQIFTSGFPVDTSIRFLRNAVSYGSSWVSLFADRLRGNGAGLYSNLPNAEGGVSNSWAFDSNTGIVNRDPGTNNYGGNTQGVWSFRRAPGVFDVVCYTGTGASQTVTHNLGATPELIVVKGRTPAGTVEADWAVYFGNAGQALALNLTGAAFTSLNSWNNTSPTASVFSVGNAATTNRSSCTFVAYLFATKAGISKVGSYTGNGSSQTINCGFGAGARFFLVKATSTTGNWWVYDSSRGIIGAADPTLALNSTSTEVTSADAVDPDNSGIIVNQEATCSINATGVSYVFLAIA